MKTSLSLGRKLTTLLALAGFLSLVGSSTAFAATINVTSTTDEDTSPGTGCSVYEAVQSANTDAAYGGCTAGSGADVVFIPSGTYVFGNGNTWSNNITITNPVSIEGPATGTRPILNASAKASSTKFTVNAANVTFKNLDVINYGVLNWDPVNHAYFNLTFQNIKFTKNSINIGCDGFTATDMEMTDDNYLGIFANDATLNNITGTNFAWLETGVENATGRGGDDITIRNVNFTDNSNIYLEKNGPGTLLLEDVLVDSPSNDAVMIFTKDANDDGTTIFRRMTVTNVVSDDAIIYDNDNTTARHVLKIENSYFANDDQAIYFSRQATESTVPTLIISDSVFENIGPWDSPIGLYAGYTQVERSSFINNSVGGWSGGAIYSRARLDVTNSLFYNNAATPNTSRTGGAIYVGVSEYKNRVSTPVASRIINNTFVGNSAFAGAALYVGDFNPSTSTRDVALAPLVVNNLFANNVGSMACRAGYTSGSGNTTNYAVQFAVGSGGNVSTDASCTGAQVVSDAGIEATPSDATTVPAVGYLSQDGFLPIIKLLTGSPAIDAGITANCPSTDQRGTVRPGDASCDAGSYEGVLGASTTTPSSPGTTPSTPPETTLANTGLNFMEIVAATLAGIAVVLVTVAVRSRFAKR